VPGAWVAVADRILALVVSEVGQERWLWQHDNMGNSTEASQVGVAHRKTLSAAVQ
jgi:hypothetical protein